MQGVWLALLLVLCLEGTNGQCTNLRSVAESSDSLCKHEEKLSGGKFVYRTIYQESPYPKECNNMTVFLKIDVSINVDTAITMSGFTNASNCRSDNLVLLKSASGSLEAGFGSSGCDLGTPGYGTWDPINFKVTIYPTKLIKANTLLAFHFTLRNPPHGMESPPIHISLGGQQLIPPTAMWKQTRVTGLTVNSTAQCFPANNENPNIQIVSGMDENIITYTALLETLSRVDIEKKPSKYFFDDCTGTTASLSIDGVQSVAIDVAGCGCSGTGGDIVAGSPQGDGKFAANFTIRYRCKGTDDSLNITEYTDMEQCAAQCFDINKICTGVVETSSIQLTNRGYGYKTAPLLFIKEPSADCNVTFKATVISGSGDGFSAYYNVTSGQVNVTNYGGNYSDNVPFVSIYGGCTPSVTSVDSFKAIVGGNLRHPYGATVMEVDEIRTACLTLGTTASCYSHDVVKSINISNCTGTTTDCTSAIHAVMKPDKVTVPADSSYCSQGDGMRATWPFGKFADWSVWGDAAPLKVYTPMFIVRRIS